MVGTLYMNTEQQITAKFTICIVVYAKSIEPITITLTTTHTLYIDNQEISSDRLAQEVKSIVTQAPQQAFVIRASKDVYYNDVIELLDMLKVNGAKYISVATDGSDSMFVITLSETFYYIFRHYHHAYLWHGAFLAWYRWNRCGL